MKAAQFLLLACLTGAVLGCGQKGPLTLPDAQKHKRTVPALPGTHPKPASGSGAVSPAPEGSGSATSPAPPAAAPPPPSTPPPSTPPPADSTHP